MSSKDNVLFILDEAAVLGHLDSIENALGIGRGYAIRLHFYFQSVGQLRRCFPEGQETTLLSNCSQLFFSVNDNTTADFVSTRLGEQTIIVSAGGVSRGTSWQHSSASRSSGNQSSSTTGSDNWNQHGRKLLKPEEVVALHARVAITFTPGVPPIRTWLLRYYEEADMTPGRSAQPRVQPCEVFTLVPTILKTLLYLFIAACMTMVMRQRVVQSSHDPQQSISQQKETQDVRNRQTSF